jgi:hypothetical protein
MMETLYVVTCVANPLLWQSRENLARVAISDWLKEPNVTIYLAECAYGSRGYQLADLAGPRVTHIPLRATTMAWSKENLLNIAISRLPPEARKIATLDADITFRRSGWATNTLNALDLYPVVQPWDKAYDLGPHDEHVQTHVSFASIYHAGGVVAATGPKTWKFNGGYRLPSSGLRLGLDAHDARPLGRAVRRRRHGLRRPSHGARDDRQGGGLDAGRRHPRIPQCGRGVGLARCGRDQPQGWLRPWDDLAPVPRPKN